MTGLPEKILAIHRALESHGLPHAFGGALALAWCTQRARGTIDIDLNVFVDVTLAGDVLAALPSDVAWSPDDLALVERDGQARLWWDTTPVDLFLDTTEFHREAASRVRSELFAGTPVPFLSCSDLAVFKAFFNRSRDWVDLEEMAAAGTLDLDRVIGALVRYLGPTDDRIERLRALDLRRRT
jgi:hypothetical protein